MVYHAGRGDDVSTLSAKVDGVLIAEDAYDPPSRFTIRPVDVDPAVRRRNDQCLVHEPLVTRIERSEICLGFKVLDDQPVFADQCYVVLLTKACVGDGGSILPSEERFLCEPL